MIDGRKDYIAELFDLASPLFLYLVSFRRKTSKGFQEDDHKVRQDLERIFDEIRSQARRDPRIDVLYEQLRFPLVVLADEILLNSEWTYRESWQNQWLLEQHYFQTNIGGDRFFQIVEDLQYDEKEAAAILFTALCLGFEGRYRSRPEQLEEWKNKLYRQLGDYVTVVQDRLTPAAYLVEPTKTVRLSASITLGRILIVAGGLVILYWLVSWIAWTGAVRQLRDVVSSLV